MQNALERGALLPVDFAPFADRLLQKQKNLGLSSTKHLVQVYDSLRRFFIDELESLIDVQVPEFKLVHLFFSDALLYSVYQLEEDRDLQVMLQETASQAEKTAREQFVLEIAHDLRNPLTGIRANAQLLLRSPEKMERTLLLSNRIVKSTERLDRMVSNLLDATQIRAGKPLALDYTTIDWAVVVQETVDTLASNLKNQFDVNLTPSIPDLSNPDALIRVIENLVSNAVKYGDPDGPIGVELKLEGELVSLSVRNQGNPISPLEQEKLFQMFGRTQAAETSGQRGWGIGLVLVKGIVESLGGSISVASSAETGTIFKIQIPRKKQS